MTHKKPSDFGKKVSQRQKDKSFEERFGEEKASSIKDKMSKKASKPWSEKFSSDKAKEMRLEAKNRMNQYNESRTWTKEKIVSAVKSYVKNNKEVRKNDFWKPSGRPIPNARIVQKHFGSLDALALELGFIFYKHDRKEYLKNNPGVVDKIVKNNKHFQKGKKYEERYDEQTNKHIKNALRNNMLKRFETEEVWNKGLNGAQKAWNRNLTKKDHEGIKKMSRARIKYMIKNKGSFVSSHEIKLKGFLESVGVDFVHQYYVKDIEHSYMADFFVKDKNLIIEVDGIYWHSLDGRKEMDDIRTKEMEDCGYSVLRFSDKDIDNDFEKVKNILTENT